MFPESNEDSELPTESPKDSTDDMVSDPSNALEHWGPCVEPVCP